MNSSATALLHPASMHLLFSVISGLFILFDCSSPVWYEMTSYNRHIFDVVIFRFFVWWIIWTLSTIYRLFRYFCARRFVRESKGSGFYFSDQLLSSSFSEVNVFFLVKSAIVNSYWKLEVTVFSALLIHFIYIHLPVRLAVMAIVGVFCWNRLSVKTRADVDEVIKAHYR